MRLSSGGQPLSIGGVNISMPMPRITVSGKNFYRNGEIWKGFGMVHSAQAWYDNFFQTGGTPEDRIAVRRHMQGLRQCGANFMRFSTQLWDFIEGPDKDNLSLKPLPFDALEYFFDVAREFDLYLVYSPNCAFLPANNPPWYDELTDHEDRWDIQEFLLKAIASLVVSTGHQTTMLSYEIANESLVSNDADGPWYTGALGIYYYVQYVARGFLEANQPPIAQAYLTKLRNAVRSIDSDALCCFGGLKNGGAFSVEHVKDIVDFFQPHIYPPQTSSGNNTDALAALAAWTTGPHAIKPCMIGETAAWSLSPLDTELFDAMYPVVEAFATFSYGYPPSRYTFDSEGNANPPANPLPPGSTPEQAFAYEISYAIQGLILQTGIDYRDRFLAIYPENDL